jgi:phosphoglucomutase
MPGSLSPLAGKPMPPGMLVNVPRVVTAYYALSPDPTIPAQRVAFGTSGHRGAALSASFNEGHILAISEAVCRYRQKARISGPLFLGKDTHALSESAFVTALEVFIANSIEVMIDNHDGYTPTPVISQAILSYNKGRKEGLADGVIISPSHNPPDEGGFKYNPTNGGPADIEITDFIEKAANDLLAGKLAGVKRIPYERARKDASCRSYDYTSAYVQDLADVVDMDFIRASGVRIGIDPLGGAAVNYWLPLIERYKLAATVVNLEVDPTYRFMSVDWDGKIRMDCSSPYAMTSLIAMRDKFDISFANDTDADRHGIVCPSSGLMNPNAFLATSISYLYANRPQWRKGGGVGKTIVSSGIIDRVVSRLGCKLFEVPVGFKWFSSGLMDGSLSFGGEESAGASFLRRDGAVWTTDKDGLIMGLLAAEMTARAGKNPALLYSEITRDLGSSFYARIDAPATTEQKARLSAVNPAALDMKELAGRTIVSKTNRAAGNGAAIGGIKVIAEDGWFAARPSGTEAVYKIYAESFRSAEHLEQIQKDAQEMMGRVFSA